MQSSRCFAFAILSALAASASLAAADESRTWPPKAPGKLPPRVEEVLRWLPADTQTVVVDQAPEKFGTARALISGSIVMTFNLHDNNKGLADKLSGKPLSLIVEGSRRFRQPKDLGLMPYQGSTIFVFADALDATSEALLHKDARRTEKILGHRVSLFIREPTEWEDEWSFYVTQVRPNTLVFATNRDYLEDLLLGVAWRGGERALPDSLNEWKHVDTSARIWAVRHYDQRDTQLDPTTPLGGVERQYGRDDEAVGLTFSYDPSKRVGVLTHLSRSKESINQVRKLWDREDMGAKLKIHRAEQGVVRVSASEVSDGALFYLMIWIALGHGVFI